MERPPAAPVHQRDGDQCHDDHDGPDADRRELGVRLAQTRSDEQVRRVVEHLKGKRLSKENALKSRDLLGCRSSQQKRMTISSQQTKVSRATVGGV